jgi:hypothetical protein
LSITTTGAQHDEAGTDRIFYCHLRLIRGGICHALFLQADHGGSMNYRVIYVKAGDLKTRTREAMSEHIAMRIVDELRRIHGLDFWAILDNDNVILSNGQG